MKSFALAVFTIAILFAGTLTLARLSSSSSEAAVPFQNNVTLEADTNRQGSDYRDFEIQADPRVCANACATDSTCRAYTYVKPGIQGPNAHCWLKNQAPNASANGCCVSGVKSGGESTPGLEVNVNRRGGDYQDFELRSNNPYECRDACQKDGRCASFTYVRPSFFGPYSHCFLKGSVPAATQETCCISGALRSGGGVGGGRVKAIGWGDNAGEHRGHNGERFSYSCPAGGTAGSLWGTGTYTDDSSICTAAVHAGLISLASGGTVTIEIRAGQQSYQGSNQNGVTSASYAAWSGSFGFVR